MDYEITFLLNHLWNGFLDPITIVISSVAFLAIVVAILIFISANKDRKNLKRFIIGLLIVLLLHFGITEYIFKNVIADTIGLRERPYMTYTDTIMPLGEHSTDSSFPSGHVSFTAGILVLFAYYFRKSWVLAAIGILIMAFARIHNGMHYPSDAFFGAMLGCSYGLIAGYISRNVRLAKIK